MNPESGIFDLSVPIMNETFASHRESTLRMLREAGTTCVFLCAEFTFIPEKRERFLGTLAANLRCLEENGLPAAVWINALGFGVPIGAAENAHAPFARITDIDGAVCDAFCPTDPGFLAYYTDYIRGIARAGASVIVLDDDLCLSVRPGLGCACERHLELFSRLAGRPVAREELRGLVYSGGPNRFRSLWLGLMGRTLENFCRAVRAAADEINPEIRIGCCAGYTSWDLEGTDALTLARILAGHGKPFLRFSGAPYWLASRRFPGLLPSGIVEFTRMQQAWCADSGAEVFDENDSFPRPRYLVPAALLESFSFCMRASGGMGELKYLLDYDSAPETETGYLAAHTRNAALMERTAELFRVGQTEGVYIHEPMRRLEFRELPQPFESAPAVMFSAFSPAAAMFAANTIPTVYSPGGARTAAAFGDRGQTVPLTGFRGYFLDFPAAEALKKRGMDVGLSGGVPACVPGFERFAQEDAHTRLSYAAGRYFRAEPAAGAETESVFESEEGEFPASYFYTNRDGVSFLVFLFDAESIRQDGDVFRSYFRQAQLLRALRRMGDTPAAVSVKNPGLYLLCRRGGGTLKLALCNFSLDPIEAPELALSRDYAPASFLNCTGSLAGRTLRLSALPAFGFAAAALEENV